VYVVLVVALILNEEVEELLVVWPFPVSKLAYKLELELRKVDVVALVELPLEVREGLGVEVEVEEVGECCEQKNYYATM